MSIEVINNTLKFSETAFSQRSLAEALAKAEQANESALAESYLEGILQSNILLGKIYNTLGRYKGDDSFYDQALTYLDTAKTANGTDQYKQEMLITSAIIHKNKKAFPQAESLLQQAHQYAEKKNSPAALIKVLCAMGALKIDTNDYNEALSLVEKCLPLLEAVNAQELDDLKTEVYNQLCQIFVKQQDYPRILEFGKTALSLAVRTQDKEAEITALNNMAVYHGDKSEYKEAMEYSLAVLEKSKAINFNYNIAQSLLNIGTIYANLYNYDEAIERYDKALREHQDVLDDYTKIIANNNLGNLLFDRGTPLESVSYFEKALQQAKAVNYQQMVALTLTHLSQVDVLMNKIDTAFKKAIEANEIFRALGEVNGRQINMINLGNIYYHQKKYEAALEQTNAGLALAQKIKDENSEIDGHKILSKIYEAQGDFAQALKCQHNYIATQNKFEKGVRHGQILDLEIKYELKEKQKQIIQLQKENEYQALLLTQKDKIVKQNAELLQVNDDLRQFAYVASHDLKEPLRMIGSYTQLIQRYYKVGDNEETKDYFTFVNEGVHRMNNLLDDLLRYATIGRNEEDFQPVKLNDVVDFAIINLRVTIEETKTTIDCDDLPTVRTNKSLLVQLFQNLLSNAIKFRKKDLAPQIAIKFEEDEDEFIISVEDNGIGIAPEFKDRVFVIFQRLHKRDKYDGTGIGLSICQKIMQRLDGRIWVESELGAGATFFVALPKK